MILLRFKLKTTCLRYADLARGWAGFEGGVEEQTRDVNRQDESVSFNKIKTSVYYNNGRAGYLQRYRYSQ